MKDVFRFLAYLGPPDAACAHWLRRHRHVEALTDRPRRQDWGVVEGLEILGVENQWRIRRIKRDREPKSELPVEVCGNSPPEVVKGS